MEIDIANLPKSPELLEQIIISLHQSTRSLHQSLHKTEAELTLLQAESAAYKEKYFRLLEEIRLAKQQRFAPSSEKNALQPDMFDEPGVELSDEVKAQIEDEIEVKGHVRKKHPIRSPLPKELPRERIMYDISETEKVCECSSHLVRIGEEITEQLKYIPAQLSVI